MILLLWRLVFLGLYGQCAAVRIALVPRASTGSGQVQNDKRLAGHSQQADRKRALDFATQAAIKRNSGDFHGALEDDSRALGARRAIGSKPEQAGAERAVGIDLGELGQLPESLRHFQHALDINSRLGDVLGTGRAAANVAATYQEMGEFEEAISFYQKALALFARPAEPRGNGTRDSASNLNLAKAMCWSDLSLCYRSVNQFRKAIECAHEAVGLLTGLGASPPEAQVIGNVGFVYLAAGRIQEALQFLNQALAELDPHRQTPAYATALTGTASCYQAMGDFKAALEKDQEALDIRRTVGSGFDIAESLEKVGTDLSYLGRTREAFEPLEESLKIRRELRNPVDLASSLGFLGNAYFLASNMGKALPLFEEAKKLYEDSGTLDMEAETIQRIGQCYDLQGEYSKAEGFYKLALGLYGEVGNQVADASQLGSLQLRISPPYDRLAEIKVNQGRPLEGLGFADAGRAQGLFRQSSQNAAYALAPSPRLKASNAQFVAALMRLRTAEGKAYGPEGRRDPALQTEVKRATDAMRTLKLRYELEKESALAQRPNLSIFLGARASVADLSRLGRNHPDTLFLEFIDGYTRYFTFAIPGRGGIRVFSSRLDETTLENEATQYLDAVGSDTAKEQELSLKLGTAFLGPLHDLLADPKLTKMVVVAEGPLLDLPIASLSDSAGHRIIDKFSVSTAVSLSSYGWRNEAQQPKQGILVVADPTSGDPDFVDLAHARQEGLAIAKLFERPTVLPGHEASESTVVRLMPLYSLLHFACHGFADSKDPFQSSLVMSGGLLRAEDILSMHLAAQMAVLSACETAKGVPSGGEGLMGLTWAFRAAGVPSVVATKWKVDDAATGRIMADFYQRVRTSGARKDDALRWRCSMRGL